MESEEPSSSHVAKLSNHIYVFVFLSQGYNSGIGGWVDKEGEEFFRVLEGEHVDEGEQKGVVN